MTEDEHWKEAHESVTVFRRPRTSPVEPDSNVKLPSGWTKGWSKKRRMTVLF
jgi:hypothetical protein